MKHRRGEKDKKERRRGRNREIMRRKTRAIGRERKGE